MHNLYCVCRAADSYNVSAPFAVKIYRSKNEGSCVSRAVKSKDIRSQTLLSDEPLSSEYGQAHPRSLTEDFSYRRQRRENSPELKPLSKIGRRQAQGHRLHRAHNCLRNRVADFSGATNRVVCGRGAKESLDRALYDRCGPDANPR